MLISMGPNESPGEVDAQEYGGYELHLYHQQHGLSRTDSPIFPSHIPSVGSSHPAAYIALIWHVHPRNPIAH